MRIPLTTICATATLIVALSSAHAFGQKLTDVAISAATEARPDWHADRFQSDAEALHDSPRHWREAASLHVRAADLFAMGDPRKIENLIYGAQLFFSVGDVQRAQEIMINAGDAALATGDVLNAASRYMDVAWLASKRNRQDDVRTFAAKARLLLLSPTISADERERIQQRAIDTSTTNPRLN